MEYISLFGGFYLPNFDKPPFSVLYLQSSHGLIPQFSIVVTLYVFHGLEHVVPPLIKYFFVLDLPHIASKAKLDYLAVQ